jgi:hypothetical protein
MFALCPFSCVQVLAMWKTQESMHILLYVLIKFQGCLHLAKDGAGAPVLHQARRKLSFLKLRA